jgi:hypothetical protein
LVEWSSHLKLDSKVILSILCDQIVPLDKPMEEEGRAIREQLQGLVVAFLTDDAQEPLLARLQNKVIAVQSSNMH